MSDRDANADDAITRRDALGLLGAGLIVAITAGDADAQRRNNNEGERGPTGDARGNTERPSATLAQRFHLGADGVVTVLTGKVECGQGARAQITQAAAEELRVPPSQVRVAMADTELCPDDGITAGSRTTPRTIPTVRQAAASMREALRSLAAARWGADVAMVDARDGALRHADGRSIRYGELAGDTWTERAAATAATRDGVTLTPIAEWKVLGQPLNRPNGRDIVVGAHHYPSDVTRPGMLYGKVLRPPTLGATIEKIDLDAARADGVSIVRDGGFVGVAAPKSHLARRAIDALAKTAQWKPNPPVDFDRLYDHLRATAKDKSKLGPLAATAATAPANVVRREYRVAYVQHVPLEPRAAVAEFDEAGKLTVWTATQAPGRVRDELMRAFGLDADKVRVIVPDFGGGFGGKHTGECAVEAARLARVAKRPVSLRWTREEEFTFASYRPAALIGIEATLSADARAIDAWAFTNVNSGNSGLRSPYRCGTRSEAFVEANAPLRHGSYRALAATANHFARECFVDELAERAGLDPLAYRLSLLDEPRMHDVLNAAAQKFDWAKRFAERSPTRGVGLACGTEKGSFTAACVAIEIDGTAIRVAHVAQAYECGKIQNPSGLIAQVQGAIVQAIGPALWEAIDVRGGVVTNGRLKDYRVPRFADVPTIDLALLDRPDLESVGAGETPIVALAPAIANAVFHATGQRVREMPVRLG